MPINYYLNRVKKFIMDILFPIECLGCGKEGVWLCDECLANIKLKKIDNCPLCKKISAYGKTHEWCREKSSLDGMIVAGFLNDKLLQDVIHNYKYNFIQKLAAPLSEILTKKIQELDKNEDKPNWVSLLFGSELILVPVPLHKRRARWRDFNQSELLAKKIADNFHIEYRPYILKRVRHTNPQVELKKEGRLDNIKNAFRVDKEWREQLKNTKILMVDDVATTGATLNECARVLKECGALEVWGLVLARG